MQDALHFDATRVGPRLLDWIGDSRSREGLDLALHRAQVVEFCGDAFVVVFVDLGDELIFEMRMETERRTDA